MPSVFDSETDDRDFVELQAQLLAGLLTFYPFHSSQSKVGRLSERRPSVP